jgi:uncharacterized protein
MYLVDVNILIYSTDQGAVHHKAAKSWLSRALAGPVQSVGLPWPNLLGFVRVATNPRIYSPPSPLDLAWRRVETFLSTPAAWIPGPGARHQQVLGQIIQDVKPTGNLISDAHLAALAVEHGLTVVSADSDFAKFTSVRWLNPLTT